MTRKVHIKRLVANLFSYPYCRRNVSDAEYIVPLVVAQEMADAGLGRRLCKECCKAAKIRMYKTRDEIMRDIIEGNNDNFIDHFDRQCWCGKELIVVGGAVDFPGDKEPCTQHYECPDHGEDYEAKK